MTGRLSTLARSVALAATLCAVAPAAASAVVPPMQLPGDARAAAGPTQPETSTWLVGARPTARAAAIGRRYGAHRVGRRGGTYLTTRARARALAAALRRAGLLWFAQPNPRLATRQAGTPDPLDAFVYWRGQVVGNAVPPAVSGRSPILAVIDSAIDSTHPEFTQEVASGIVRYANARPMTDGHGTGVSATAGAPANGVGIRGIWPGMRLLSIALPEPSTCSDSVNALDVASRTAGVRAINMSYGHEGYCFPEELGVGYAFAAGEVPVAAAGNEFQEGNPLSFPAVLPHVMTVAATKQDFTSADFSSSNAGVDISAPGVGIVTAWPARFDDDGRVDGYQSVDGTSFSSPMVAAAATWIKAARPSLGPGQISDVLRSSARDIWRPGYDTDTGFGLLNIPGALAARVPRIDPLEPNDEIYWIDGRAFDKPDPFLWNGQSSRSIHGTIDSYEDTFDVYRIRLRPRGRVTIAADPEYGDPVLFGFRSSAKSVYSSAGRLFRINRHGEGGTEGVTIANGSRRSYLNAYIAVSISGSARTLDSAYSLRFTRRSSLR